MSKTKKPVSKNLKEEKNKILGAEDLTRANFAGIEFLKSETALKYGIDNMPKTQQIFKNLGLVADKMQQLRDYVERPITITSGYRCFELNFNKEIRGAPNSRHMEGLACDFNIEGLHPIDAVVLIKKSGISFDKVFLERGCVHIQICQDESKNQNLFAAADKINGEWVVKKL